MLPKPDLSFTIPSIHDNANLECRIHHPKRSQTNHYQRIRKCGAIFAHPYAPLGGCFDDPVVAAIGSEILEAGFVLGTFNFRGAGASEGSTSWTARGELSDYISFAGLFLLYLRNLDKDALCNLQVGADSRPDPIIGQTQGKASSEFELPLGTPTETIIVFGGYSYGSMICLNLPSVTEISSHFTKPSPGSSQSEIVLRASHLSKQRKHDSELLQADHTAASQGSLLDSCNSTRIGGDELKHAAFKPDKHFRQSLDKIKRNVDLPKAKQEIETHKANHSTTSIMSSSSQTKPQYPAFLDLRCHYLLISPLLPPISTFATMFTKLKASRANNSSTPNHPVSCDPAASDSTTKLTENPTMAIYGDQDAFTSHKKLRRWAESLKQVNGSCFDFHEIAGAGHFWHEEGVEMQMKTLVKTWLERICPAQAGV